MKTNRLQVKFINSSPNFTQITRARAAYLLRAARSRGTRNVARCNAEERNGCFHIIDAKVVLTKIILKN